MSKIKDVTVPDIGDFDMVEVIEVLVKSGDTIALEDPLITMESDKASMDVPSPFSGTVKDLKLKAGDKVSQNDLILTLKIDESEIVSSETLENSISSLSSLGKNAPANTGPLSTVKDESKSLESRPPERVRRPPTIEMPIDQKDFLQAHAGPSVRKFARELGVDLRSIRGSGRKQRITKEDVQEFVKQTMRGIASGPTKAAGSGIPEMPEIDFSKFGPVEIQPLSRIKKKTGKNLHRSWLNLPIVTHHDEADITELEQFRKSLKEEAAKQNVRVTALAFLLKASAVAIREHPNFNSSLAADNENLVLKKYLNIGVAVDTPDGLVVPVIRDVEHKGLLELAKELGELGERARAQKLQSSDLQGGCFSISSLGGIGGTAFTPLVNAPEVAILGVTRSRMMPVWDGKEFLPRLMLPLDLTYDHRVIDGAEAARFLVDLCNILADLRRMSL